MKLQLCADQHPAELLNCSRGGVHLTFPPTTGKGLYLHPVRCEL